MEFQNKSKKQSNPKIERFVLRFLLTCQRSKSGIASLSHSDNSILSIESYMYRTWADGCFYDLKLVRNIVVVVVFR